METGLTPWWEMSNGWNPHPIGHPCLSFNLPWKSPPDVSLLPRFPPCTFSSVKLAPCPHSHTPQTYASGCFCFKHHSLPSNVFCTSHVKNKTKTKTKITKKISHFWNPNLSPLLPGVSPVFPSARITHILNPSVITLRILILLDYSVTCSFPFLRLIYQK